MTRIVTILSLMLLMLSCGNGAKGVVTNSDGEKSPEINIPQFNADSAYSYVGRQVEFGPRIPNSTSHEAAARWLASELRRHGAEVMIQEADLEGWDGKRLKMKNIFGSYNPEMDNRLLLLAHYDTRPWADEDKDERNHVKAPDGANDGASGVGVLLEIARELGAHNPGKGIDILFVDMEDYGRDGDEESWALGARYFAEHPIKDEYRPSRAVLLDMVGGKGALFPREYFSAMQAPALDDSFRASARQAGHGEFFPDRVGSAVTDDHVELLKRGIPAIDIIDYREGEGFCSTWHTLDDNMDNIDIESLKRVGESLIRFVYSE